jgi:hypothetical protein
MSQNLPRLNELLNPLDGATLEAYNSVLRHEQWADSVELSVGPTPAIRDRKLICARVLGRLLLEAPSVRGRDSVVEEVTACEDDKHSDP